MLVGADSLIDVDTVLAENIRIVPLAYCPTPYLSPTVVPYCFTIISPGSLDVI